MRTKPSKSGVITAVDGAPLGVYREIEGTPAQAHLLRPQWVV